MSDMNSRYGNINQGLNSTMGDFIPNPRRHEDLSSKQQDYMSDRLDSGIDSYVSMDDRYNSVTSQMSNMSIKSISHITSLQSDDRLHDNIKSVDSTEGFQDPGYQSYNSFPEEHFLKPESTSTNTETENLNKTSDFQDILQWYLPDNEGDTCLQLAIIQKKVDMAFNIIQMCTLPALLDVANENCQTPLHLAVLTDQPQLVRCLVAYGANVTCKDRQGNTPLHIACERGMRTHVEMLTTTLDPNEDPGFQSTSLPQNVNEKNYQGLTPLHLAAIYNCPHVISILINQLYCDVNMPDVTSGRTALHHAVERQNMESTRMLLKCKPDVNALTYDECSPLHLAAAYGLRSEASVLLDNGADLYLITRDDQDVFELAAHNRRVYNLLRDMEQKYKARRHSELNVIG